MGRVRPGGERSNGGLGGGRIEGLAICSTSGTTLLAALSEEGRVPLAPFATYGTEELAGYAGEALGDAHSACLLKNHGTITVGETVGKAYSLTEILEEMAEIYYRTRIAGDPHHSGPRLGRRDPRQDHHLRPDQKSRHRDRVEERGSEPQTSG